MADLNNPISTANAATVNNISSNDIKFRDSSNILISDCSQSGKTEFAKRLLSHTEQMFVTPPEVCLFAYSHWQQSYDELQQLWGDRITFMEDLPSAEFLSQAMQGRKHGIFVMDDKASELPNSAFCMDLLTRYAHHFNLSNLIIVQDPSLRGKMKSVLSKNFHVNVLMRSPRDRNFIRSLGLMLNDYRCLIQSYDDACSNPFGYLCVDLHPLANPEVKYRSSIFPDDPHCVIYKNKSTY